MTEAMVVAIEDAEAGRILEEGGLVIEGGEGVSVDGFWWGGVGEDGHVDGKLMKDVFFEDGGGGGDDDVGDAAF